MIAHMVPIVSTVDTLCIEQTWSLGTAKEALKSWSVLMFYQMKNNRLSAFRSSVVKIVLTNT